MTDFFSDLLGWIESHLHSNLKLENVSIKSGYSKWHLQRMFQDHMGISLGRYIRNRKITNAALLIKTSQLTMVDICEESGFSSQQTFSRFFKKHYGITPGHYRKTHFISYACFQGSLALSSDFSIQHEKVMFISNLNDQDEENICEKEEQEFTLSLREESIEILFYEKLIFFILDVYERNIVIPSSNEFKSLIINAGFKKTSIQRDPVIHISADDVTCFNSNDNNGFIRFYYDGYISDIGKFINKIYFIYMKENEINREYFNCDVFCGCIFQRDNRGCIKGYYYIPLSGANEC
ncbi:helix-turn-helix domain-containing protein [Citrobacter amalonaticus]|nr:helix-turn-helix domain-containing protein [Citrobacter amalonaticus]